MLCYADDSDVVQRIEWTVSTPPSQLCHGRQVLRLLPRINAANAISIGLFSNG